MAVKKSTAEGVVLKAMGLPKLPKAGAFGASEPPVEGECVICGEPFSVARAKYEYEDDEDEVKTAYRLDVEANCEHIEAADDLLITHGGLTATAEEAQSLLPRILAELKGEELPEPPRTSAEEATPEIVIHERVEGGPQTLNESLWTWNPNEEPVPPRKIEFLVEPLLYQATHHLVSGPSGKGKSLFWFRIACQLGPRAAWLDQENHDHVMWDRLTSYGDVQRPWYIDNAAFNYERFEQDVLPALVAAEVEVVFFDPARLFYRVAGVNDFGAYGGVDEYHMRVFQRLNAAGISTVQLDNTTKNDSAGAKGDGAKRDNAMLEWSLSQKSPVSRTRAGLIELQCLKDRYGRVGEQTTFKYRIGGSPFVFEPAGEGKAPAKRLSDNQELWDRAVDNAKAALAEANGPMTKSELLARLGGNRNTNSAALTAAAERGEFITTPGKRGAILFALPGLNEEAA